MNIKEFTEKMRITIADILKKEVQIITPLKINGIRLYGIAVIEPDTNANSTIYLESFFEKFLDTDNWPQTVTDVLTFYNNYRFNGSFDMKWFKDFSQIRKKLFYRLINYEANQELLSMIPHTRFLDLAKIYYVDCQIGETESGSILIYHKHVTGWGITEQELIDAAEENTPLLYPIKIHHIATGLTAENAADVIFDISVESSDPMFALTNTESQHGAAAICYKDVLDHFSQKMKDDLVILPSSIHETMLLPLHQNNSIDYLKETVYDANRTILDHSEFLSDNVYIYNRMNRQLVIA